MFNVIHSLSNKREGILRYLAIHSSLKRLIYSLHSQDTTFMVCKIATRLILTVDVLYWPSGISSKAFYILFKASYAMFKMLNFGYIT